MNGTGSNSEARKRAAELADPVRVAADRGHRAADLRGEVARLEAEVARLRAMGAPFRVQRVMDARDEFAVEVTAFAAGKIDGQQCLAGVLAVHERLIAAHPAPEGVTLTDAEVAALREAIDHDETWRDGCPLDRASNDTHALIAAVERIIAARQAPTVALDVETVTQAVRGVTDLWDEPLDEVHDVPPIVNAVLAADPRRTVAEVQAEERERLAADLRDRVPHIHQDAADRDACTDGCGWLTWAADRIEAGQ